MHKRLANTCSSHFDTVTCGTNKRAHLSRKLLSTLKAHTQPLGLVKLDGKFIATGSADGSIAIWSKHNFKLLHHIRRDDLDVATCGPGGCTGGVLDMAFDKGVLLVTGWAGYLKVARLDQQLKVPRFATLGESFRHFQHVRLRDGKGYVVMRREGNVCVEVSPIF